MGDWSRAPLILILSTRWGWSVLPAGRAAQRTGRFVSCICWSLGCTVTIRTALPTLSTGEPLVLSLNLVKTTKPLFFDTSVRLDRHHVVTEGSTVRLSSSQCGGGRWTGSSSVHWVRGCVGPQSVCTLRRRRRPLFLPGVKPWCSGRCTVVRPDGQSHV